jgi:CPA1 family monovalent cation:H+ antiporter
MLDIAAAFLTITAVLAYFNRRYIGLPPTIGVMVVALTISLAIIGLDKAGFGMLRDYEESLLKSIDFSELLMQGMLSLLLTMAASGEAPSPGHAAMLLVEEAGGGILLGLVIGYLTYRMLKSINSYQEEVLITLAAVIGGYALASWLHVSGPLAMVVVGLIIGNHGRSLAMSEKTRACRYLLGAGR